MKRILFLILCLSMLPNIQAYASYENPLTILGEEISLDANHTFVENSIEISKAGYYDVIVSSKKAKNSSVSKVKLYTDGSFALFFRLPESNGKYQDVNCGSVWLSEGIHDFKMELNGLEGFSCNKIRLKSNGGELHIPMSSYLSESVVVNRSVYDAHPEWYARTEESGIADGMAAAKDLSSILMPDGRKGTAIYDENELCYVEYKIYTAPGDYDLVLNRYSPYNGSVTAYLDGKQIFGDGREQIYFQYVGVTNEYLPLTVATIYNLTAGEHTIAFKSLTASINVSEFSLKPYHDFAKIHLTDETGRSVPISGANGAGVSVEIANNCNFEGKYSLISATYCDNRLINVKTKELIAETGTTTEDHAETAPIPGDNYTKLFLCRSNLIQPICDYARLSGNVKEFYVSPKGNDLSDGSDRAPLKTIGEAKKRISRINKDMRENIVVYLAGGDYELSSPIEFTSDDSATNGYHIIYKAKDYNDKPVLTGGKKLNGWEYLGDNRWKIENVGVSDVRQLYVDGKRWKRAKSDFMTGISDYRIAGEGLSGINIDNNIVDPNEASDAEVVWNIEWMQHRYPVSRIEKTNTGTKIVFEQPYADNITNNIDDQNNVPSYSKAFYIENAKELMDAEGEWYYDKEHQTIYCYSEHDLSNAIGEIPVTEKLMSINGSALDDKVTGLVFDGIDFQYGGWTEPNRIGYGSFQANVMIDTVNGDGKRMSDSQITVSMAKDLIFQNNRFMHLGSNAIAFDNSVEESDILYNRFYDISGSAIVIGSVNVINNSKDHEICKKIRIRQNYIEKAGAEYECSPGITVYYASRIDIINNTLKNLPYSGISYGFDMGAHATWCRDSRIMRNKILDSMKVLDDGAPIYTAGTLLNTDIAYNYLSGSGHFRGGIYSDHGSMYGRFYGNVIEKIAMRMFNSTHYWLWDWHKDNFNNSFFDNYIDRGIANSSAKDTVENTKLISENIAEVQNIINHAGVDYESEIDNGEIRMLLDKVENAKTFLPYYDFEDYKLMPNQQVLDDARPAKLRKENGYNYIEMLVTTENNGHSYGMRYYPKHEGNYEVQVVIPRRNAYTGYIELGINNTGEQQNIARIHGTETKPYELLQVKSYGTYHFDGIDDYLTIYDSRKNNDGKTAVFYPIILVPESR